MKYGVLECFLSLSVKWPKAVLLLVLLLVVACGFGLTKLSFTDDIRVFFDQDNKQLVDYEKLEDTYSKTNSILFVVEPKDANIFTKRNLAIVEEITQRAWKVPYSRRVDSLTNFQYTYGTEDDLVVRDLVEGAKNMDASSLSLVREVALAEPLLVNRLVSAEGHVAGVNVPINLPGVNPLVEQPEVAEAARSLAADIMKENPDVRVHITGLVMINNALAEEGKADMELLVPLMFVAILLIMGLLLKNIMGVIVTFMMILLSVVMAMGVAGWLGVVLSPPVLSASNIIMTVAVADAVHILVGFLGLWSRGVEKSKAIVQTLCADFKPITITSVTTALGFLSMNYSDSPPFRDLGNIVAAGVMVAWILTFTFKPALLMLLPIQRSRGDSRGERLGLLSKSLMMIAEFVIVYYKQLIVVVSLVVVCVSLGILRNQTNDEFLKYFHEDLDFRKATDFTIDELTGFEFIEYSLDSGETGGINNPEFLRKVDQFATWYREQEKVRHVYNFAEIMKRLNKNMHANDVAWYKIPDDKELAAQYLLLYEMSLPFGLDLTNQINIDKSSLRMRVSLDHVTTNEILELEEKADRWIEENAKGVFTSFGSGQSLMFAHIGSSNIHNLLGGSVLALFLISVLLIVAFASLKFGILSLIPNLLPAAMAFGIWGIMVGQVGLGLAVVVGMTLGIVVDDTVHFLTSYLRLTREKGLSAVEAIRQTFMTVGRAITVTSIVLVVGFGVLAMSNFELNSGMALMSGLTIVMALLADFLLLPAILILMERDNVK